MDADRIMLRAPPFLDNITADLSNQTFGDLARLVCKPSKKSLCRTPNSSELSFHLMRTGQVVNKKDLEPRYLTGRQIIS
jgi:hypothetical protein